MRLNCEHCGAPTAECHRPGCPYCHDAVKLAAEKKAEKERRYGKDFLTWVDATFSRREPHLLFPGCHVLIAKMDYPTVLTAEQAEYLATRLLKLARG